MAQKYFEQSMRKSKINRDGGKPKSTKKTPYWTVSDGTPKAKGQSEQRVACPWKPGKS